MKRFWMASMAVAGLFAAGSAMAQDAPPPPDQSPPPGQTETKTVTTTTWTVKPEERTVIHDYVVKEKMRPAPVQEEISVGEAVPPGVELQPVPEEIYSSVPEARSYEYFDWNGRVVFVDPGSHRVVQIVD